MSSYRIQVGALTGNVNWGVGDILVVPALAELLDNPALSSQEVSNRSIFTSTVKSVLNRNVTNPNDYPFYDDDVYYLVDSPSNGSRYVRQSQVWKSGAAKPTADTIMAHWNLHMSGSTPATASQNLLRSQLLQWGISIADTDTWLDPGSSGYSVVDAKIRSTLGVATAATTTPATTPAVTPPKASANTKLGDTGEEVLDLQTMLQALGYNPGTLDGIFGQNTLAAVKAFQKANSLSVDGIVGPLTQTALDTSYAALSTAKKATATAAKATAASSGAGGGGATITTTTTPAKTSGSSLGWIIGSILVLAAAGGIGYQMLGKKKKPKPIDIRIKK